MGLLTNNFRLNTGVQQRIGDVQSRTPGNFSRYSSFCNTRSQARSITVLSRVAYPLGSNGSSSFFPPQEAGGAVMRSLSSGDLSASGVLEKTGTIAMTGSGDLEALASLIKSAIVAMTGDGTLTADGAGNAIVSLDMTGSGDMSADAYAIANAVLDLIGSGDLSSDAYGIANASIDIVVTGTGLTVENVGQFVWQAILSDFDSDPNSAAAKLLSAGSSGDPWSTTLPGSYTADQAGAILDRLEDLSKKIKALTTAGL